MHLSCTSFDVLLSSFTLPAVPFGEGHAQGLTHDAKQAWRSYLHEVVMHQILFLITFHTQWFVF